MENVIVPTSEGEWEFEVEEFECKCGHFEEIIYIEGYYVDNTAIGNFYCPSCLRNTEVEKDITAELEERHSGDPDRYYPFEF